MDNSFGEIFNVELECWCYGISHATEKVDHRVLHQVIKSFAPVIREAIENLYAFDILDTAKRLVRSGKCKPTEEKEIVFYLLSTLPTPRELTKEQNDVLIQIVNQVEDVYGGAFSRLEKKWKGTSHTNFSQIHLTPSSYSIEQLNLPNKPHRDRH